MIKTWFPVVTRGDLLNHYRQMESLAAIYSLLNNDFALDRLRGWAISPDNLIFVLNTICEFDKPTVVEFGSGQSTIAIAKLIHARQGRLITVEHDKQYFAKINRKLEVFKLNDCVTSIVNPLMEHDEYGKTYDLSLLPNIEPDVVLVDGPPGQGKARLAPMIWACENLQKNGVLLLDDYNRDAEKNCVSELGKLFSDLDLEEYPTEKQLAKIRRTTA
jgi:predicted O-methyltransferase YrrM